jgi:TfoX/Sxy family transcriptional regulator of competence genes
MKGQTTAMTHLGERIRALLDGDPRVTEKFMFGGLTFLLNGRILAGCKKDGSMLLSVGKAHHAEALARPGTAPMTHGKGAMTGFVWVEPAALEDDDDLADWITTVVQWVAAMPPK